MPKKLLLSAVLMLATLCQAGAQYRLIGTEPPSVRWNRMTSEHYDIIYPEGIDSLARVYLYNFEKTRDFTKEGLNIEPPAYPLILHPYLFTTQDLEGGLSCAPNRVDLFTTPDFTPLSGRSWELYQALLYGRNIAQMGHYKVGIYKFLNIIGGEQGTVVGAGLYPASKILSGDAIQNETDYPGLGSGDSPEMLKFFRAKFVAGEHRSYTRWKFGTYTDYNPLKYEFGYLVSEYMRYNSGNFYTGGDILEEQVRSWWRIFSVSHRSYIRGSGLTFRKNLRHAEELLAEVWRSDLETRKPFTPVDTIPARKDRRYVEYMSPVPLNGKIYATLKGVDYGKSLVSFDENGRRRELTQFSKDAGNLVPDGDKTFLFSEVIPDPRWDLRKYSILREYDVSTGHFRNITHKSRLVNPVYSASRDSILAVDLKVDGKSDAVILDRATGRELGRISAPEGCRITGIVRSQDAYFATVINDSGIGLACFRNGRWTDIVKPQEKSIRDLRACSDGSLYFISDLDGISNVYIYHPDEERLQRLTTARFSVAGAYIDEKNRSLLYSDFNSKGYTPVRASFDSLAWKDASFTEHRFLDSIPIINSKLAAEYVQPLPADKDSLLRESIFQLPSKRYSKTTHAFRIHSWAPLYVNLADILNDRLSGFKLQEYYKVASLGAMVIGQNNLGTLFGTAAYSYHKGFHAAHLNLNYSGLYPVFDLTASFNDRYKTTQNIVEMDYGRYVETRLDTIHKPAVEAMLTTYIPFNLSSEGWDRGFTPELQYKLTNDEITVNTRTFHISHSIQYGLTYYSLAERPRSALSPRWGVGLEIKGQNMFGYKEASGNMLYQKIYLYLPGVIREQGTKITFSWQHQYTNQSYYNYMSNLASVPRGYSKEILMDYRKISLDYAIPINGIDGGIPWLMYIKRIQIVPFVDYAHDSKHLLIDDKGYVTGTVPKNYFSFGTALLIGAHWCNIGTELKLGVRYARTIEGHNSFSFIMSTGL